MSYTTHSIYFGTQSTTVGITIKPTPSLTLQELDDLINELRAIREDMSIRHTAIHAGNWED